MRQWLLLFLFFAFFPNLSFGGDIPTWADTYVHRYPLATVYDKLIDNKGDGFEPLYGLRNLRVVLKGVVYRSGANNAYNRNGKRSGMNPIPETGLDNLCNEGFGKVFYLYKDNYKTASPSKKCQSFLKASHQMDYLQKGPYDAKELQVLLETIKSVIDGKESGPILLHCWNGWHASGLISALALRQFCGVSGEAAVAYWDQNTDGRNVGSQYEGHRKAIRNYQPDAKLVITAAQQMAVCPHL